MIGPTFLIYDLTWRVFSAITRVPAADAQIKSFYAQASAFLAISRAPSFVALPCQTHARDRGQRRVTKGQQ